MDNRWRNKKINGLEQVTLRASLSTVIVYLITFLKIHGVEEEMRGELRRGIADILSKAAPKMLWQSEGGG